MDSIDIRLLDLLQKNSRITVSELSKELNLSRPSITERMLRLKEQGIIEEYSARISLKSLKITPKNFEEKISNDADILECHRVTGETDYFIKAAVNNIEDMGMLIDRMMPYGDLSTSVVILSPVPYRHVLPKITNQQA